jgi:hypothetical protein
MKIRFRLIHPGERGSTLYCVDSETGQRFSLKTKDRDSAEQIVLAKNQALRQPTLNLQIAKAYLAGTDSGVSTRTWQDALNALVETKHEGPLGARRQRPGAGFDPKQKQNHPSRPRPKRYCGPSKAGTVSTNVHLSKLHNFCLSIADFPSPLVERLERVSVITAE